MHITYTLLLYILLLLLFFFILMVAYQKEVHPKLKKLIYVTTILSTVVMAFWQIRHITNVPDVITALGYVLILANLVWYALKLYKHYDVESYAVVSLSITKALFSATKIVAGILFAALLLVGAIS